ncbi:ribosome-binding factor A [Geobacter pelophilus]|jgi:ribosome-binding factor A|uniref:Ribosome-binding factor A n=1 Tax=Geoanaerobacter pelophilus TaxID=60036 RepID=A0AAW4L9P4_9BACT|nr:ribosome-binding factor A [Geoanaerobacter pelophilus]MBT0665783.1 ribosome-binding factor A [Geoanaerobacter pelophilus]
MYKRSEKVGEAVHEIVTELIIKGLKDPRIGFVTVTGVKVTDDMHYATVYFTVIGDEAARKGTEAGLNSARGFIRREMGKKLHMRYVPEILFKYDTSLDTGNHIDALLREIKANEQHDTEDQ